MNKAMAVNPAYDQLPATPELEVVVTIITLKRLQGLARLLGSLQQLTFVEADPPAWGLVVVDNDANGSAKAVVEEFEKTFPVPIIYGVEPLQGIAAARNKAISLAPECQFIAFIDDDEVADPHWLEQLLLVAQAHQADIVTGPVLPDFEAPPPRWILRGKFFDRRRLKTGSRVHFAATHNTLVKCRWTQNLDGPFDMRFNLSGGSDSHFSRRVIQGGGQVIWADEALVTEFNPPRRMTVSWLLQRSFRIAYTTALIEKDLYTFWIVLLRLVKALYHLVLGLLLIIPQFILFGFAGLIKALQQMARGAGALYALLGGRYEEYARR